jgi:hypothetical protein
MMQTVANVKLAINEEVSKGTQVQIKYVSPNTIDVGENIPSPNTPDASEEMISPLHINRWRNEFIEKFGDEGYIEKGLNLPWNWSVVGNEKYEEWKNSGIKAKADWINREREQGRTSGLD